MAKELPYFKFEPNQWDNGNIQMLSREHKGLFIDLCAMYWSRLGDVPLKLAIQKLCGGNATALNPLCDEKIIEILDGNIFIKFLSEQLNEFEDISKQNSKNAKYGWEKRHKLKETAKLSERNATASNSQCESNAIREEKIREENKRDINLENSIMTFWGYTETANFDKLRIVSNFVTTLINTNRIEYFKQQFENYKNVKKANPTYKHSLNNFLGDQSQRFENGKWDSEVWATKLLVDNKITKLPNGIIDHSNNKTLFI